MTIVCSNGKTSGITLPSADGQEAVIRKAYAKACIGFSETAYVECHGTGTKVGDVIEGKSRLIRDVPGLPRRRAGGKKITRSALFFLLTSLGNVHLLTDFKFAQLKRYHAFSSIRLMCLS